MEQRRPRGRLPSQVMPDTDIDPDLDCPHLEVEMVPWACEQGHMHDTWECKDCGEEFTLASETASWHDAAHELRALAENLGQANARARVAAGVLGLMLFGFLVGRR